VRALGAAAFAVAGVAFAQAEGFRMLNDTTNPFPYYIDGRSNSPTSNLLLQDIQTATDDAWQTWQQVPCNDDAFVDLGPSTNNPNITDPENIYGQYNLSTVWITDGGDPYYNYALVGQVVGMAIPQAYGGILYNCDIFLNAVDFTWSVNGQAPAPIGNVGWADVWSIVLHESGHCQGLGHTDNVADVMYPYEALDTTKRVLSVDDVQQVCSIAPKTGAVGSPCQTTPDCQATGLSCIKPPLPDGGTAESMCSEGCDPDAGIVECPTPFVCEYSSLTPGSPGSCLAPTANYVTKVGASCESMADCGGPAGICQTFNFPSGDPQWVDGYCTQLCGSQFEPCPANAVCANYAGGDQCLVTCRPGGADCRPTYACAPFGDGTQGVCVPGCGGDQDCASGYLCRTCDGLCIAQQNPSGRIGDICTSPSQCGAGQLCLGFGTNPMYGVCSAPCGSSCSACPTGSGCLPVGTDGALWCLVDCAAGRCATGLYCGQTSDGPACLPATCATANDCPVGDSCVNGVCQNPFSDGGNPCPLCFDGGTLPDSGSPGYDGGTSGGNGGCGCAGTSQGPMELLILAALATLRRRRPWDCR
jgi:MYXO-CTERM domain-containing protein